MKTLSIFLCLLAVLTLSGCGSPPAETLPESRPTASQPEPISPETVPAISTPPAPQPPAPKDPLDEILENLTIEERVGQLFLARCDDAAARTDVQAYHLGGFVLFKEDFENQMPDTVRAKLSDYQAAARLPLLLAVDEEGGTVTRISRFKAFRDKPFPSIRSLYASGGIDSVLTVEAEKCQLLKELGLNVNLGPVCDISTDPGAFMYQRSLGLDAATTASVTANLVTLMSRNQIGSVLKHFPGYGNNADTHTGIAVDSRSLEELEGNDLLPFVSGIQAGCGAILVSHTIVEALDADTPASLSPIVHSYLREVMGFDGVILTDDLVMQAITDAYGAGEAAVLAVLAGNDMLCSTDYATQYQAVLDAVMDGRISFDTLNAAVRHVLQWKQSLGLLGEEIS